MFGFFVFGNKFICVLFYNIWNGIYYVVLIEVFCRWYLLYRLIIKLVIVSMVVKLFIILIVEGMIVGIMMVSVIVIRIVIKLYFIFLILLICFLVYLCGNRCWFIYMKMWFCKNLIRMIIISIVNIFFNWFCFVFI